MTIDVKLNILERFEVKASPEDTFRVLSDVPYSVSHYPDVEGLEDEGAGVFRWSLKKMGTRGFSHRVVYACRYLNDADKGLVTWNPVNDVGNCVTSGSWKISASGEGSSVVFKTDVILSIEVPRMLKSVAAPFARKSFEVQIARYLKNLRATLDG